jgi:antitoxin ParD1/3/4
MPAKHTRHVALTAPLELYVENQVAIGAYASVSEIVRAALRLLMERDADRAEYQKKSLPHADSEHHGRSL